MRPMFNAVTDPERCAKVDDAADIFVHAAICAIIRTQGVHPASASCAALASVIRILGSMNEEGLQLIAAALLAEKADMKKQEAGMKLLVDAYDQKMAEMERAEHGGPLQ